MESLIKYLSGEGRVILQAPATFLIAIAIVGGVVWAAMNWTYSAQITNLQSRISLKDDQIADYRNKLSGATPDEARAKFNELERQIVALSPRRLSQEQKMAMTQKLSVIKAAIAIVQDMAVPDARGLANDLKFVFQSNGWSVQSPMVMGLPNPPPTGISLHVANQNDLTAPELAVKSALEAARLEFDIQGGFYSPTSLSKNDLELIITSRLN